MRFSGHLPRAIRLFIATLGMLSALAISSAPPAGAAESDKDRCQVPYLKVLPKKAGKQSNIRIFAVIECPKDATITMKVNARKSDGTKTELASARYAVTVGTPLVVTPKFAAPALMDAVCVNISQGETKINTMCTPART